MEATAQPVDIQVIAAELTSTQWIWIVITFMALAIWEQLAPLARGKRPRLERWPANLGLGLVNGLLLTAIPVGSIVAAQWASRHGFGFMNILDVPIEIAVVLGVLFRSFISWGTHVAMHQVPWLWRMHRVHHSDEFFDISTTTRLHVFDLVAGLATSAVGTVLFGIPVLAIVICDLADAAFGLFHHANIRLPRWIERPLRWVIITPELHRIHHSTWRPETDSNYGAQFSIWDRLFGTYREEFADPDQALGLLEWRGAEARSLTRLLVNPFEQTPRSKTKP